MNKECEKCNGEMVRLILQQKAPGEEGYYSPRLLERCKKCRYTVFIQKLPMVDYKIEGAVTEL